MSRTVYAARLTLHALRFTIVANQEKGYSSSKGGAADCVEKIRQLVIVVIFLYITAIDDKLPRVGE